MVLDRVGILLMSKTIYETIFQLQKESQNKNTQGKDENDKKTNRIQRDL